MQTIKSIPIIPAGGAFTPDELAAIARNGELLAEWLRPPVVAQCVALADEIMNSGKPAAGTAVNLRVEDSALVGDVADAPEWLAGLLRSDEVEEIRAEVYAAGKPPEGLPPAVAANIAGPVLRSVMCIGGQCIRTLADLASIGNREQFTERKQSLRHVAAHWLSSHTLCSFGELTMCTKNADQQQQRPMQPGYKNPDHAAVLDELAKYYDSAVIFAQELPPETAREMLRFAQELAPDPAAVQQAAAEEEGRRVEASLRRTLVNSPSRHKLSPQEAESVIQANVKAFSEMRSTTHPRLTARQFLGRSAR